MTCPELLYPDLRRPACPPATPALSRTTDMSAAMDGGQSTPGNGADSSKDTTGGSSNNNHANSSKQQTKSGAVPKSLDGTRKQTASPVNGSSRYILCSYRGYHYRSLHVIMHQSKQQSCLTTSFYLSPSPPNILAPIGNSVCSGTPQIEQVLTAPIAARSPHPKLGLPAPIQSPSAQLPLRRLMVSLSMDRQRRLKHMQ